MGEGWRVTDEEEGWENVGDRGEGPGAVLLACPAHNIPSSIRASSTSVCLSVCLSLCLSFCLSVCLSVCLSPTSPLFQSLFWSTSQNFDGADESGTAHHLALPCAAQTCLATTRQSRRSRQASVGQSVMHAQRGAHTHMHTHTHKHTHTHTIPLSQHAQTQSSSSRSSLRGSRSSRHALCCRSSSSLAWPLSPWASPSSQPRNRCALACAAWLHLQPTDSQFFPPSAGQGAVMALHRLQADDFS
jgi:hypothetical protein